MICCLCRPGFYYWETFVQIETLLLVIVDVYGQTLQVAQQAVLLQVRCRHAGAERGSQMVHMMV